MYHITVIDERSEKVLTDEHTNAYVLVANSKQDENKGVLAASGVQEGSNDDILGLLIGTDSIMKSLTKKHPIAGLLFGFKDKLVDTEEIDLSNLVKQATTDKEDG